MRNIWYLSVYRYILRIVWSFAALDAISQQAARADSDWRKKGPPLLAYTTVLDLSEAEKMDRFIRALVQEIRL